MGAFRNLKLGTVVFGLLMIPQLVFGWGRTGHMIVANVGSTLARSGTEFWKSNTSNMVILTLVPDLNWKQLPTNEFEKPTHFFQPDSYTSDDPTKFDLIPRLYSENVKQRGKEFVDKNGTAVWRVAQFYQLALDALKQRDFKTAVEMAGAMSHYIGDISQPLHDTHNYDGQETNQKGIHKFFETDNIDIYGQNKTRDAVGAAAMALLKDSKFMAQFKGPLIEGLFWEVKRGFAQKDLLLNIDKQKGRTGTGAKELYALAVKRMADGAATLAVVLSRLWAESGINDSGVSVNIDVPKWVPPLYPMIVSCRVPSSYDDDCGH